MKRLVPFSAISFLLLLTMTLDCLASALPVTREELILESRDVIHGIVKEVRSDWNENHSMVYTYVTLEVLHVFKGEPRDEVVIQVRGGSVGGSGVWVSDQPEFKEGMEVIIHTFLRVNGNLGIYGGDRGLYITNNGLIEKLNMTLDQFKKLVDDLIKK
jgi:hypothetical protein